MPSAPSVARRVLLRSGCKINLYLRVGPRRPDGYHDLESLFIPLSLPCDEIEIVREEDEAAPDAALASHIRQDGDGPPAGLRVSFSSPDIDPRRNTLTKAYAWYAAQTGFAPKLSLTVRKGVPHGAGLGGGSADAAALLAYLQQEAPAAGFQPLDEEDLLRRSAAIGADVPFFLLGTPAKAAGVGELLCPVPNPVKGRFLLLLCPDIVVSTGWAFAALDEQRKKEALECKKNTIRSLTSTKHQATYSFVHEMVHGNDFEKLVFARFPELGELYARLCRTGADIVRMSGTGSSLFALFKQSADAEKMRKTLAEENYRVYMQSI